MGRTEVTRRGFIGLLAAAAAVPKVLMSASKPDAPVPPKMEARSGDFVMVKNDGWNDFEQGDIVSYALEATDCGVGSYHRAMQGYIYGYGTGVAISRLPKDHFGYIRIHGATEVKIWPVEF